MIGNKLFVQETGPAADNDILLRSYILKTLKYFHVFRHPLYADEIFAFLQIPVSKSDLQHTLAAMVRDESIFLRTQYVRS